MPELMPDTTKTTYTPTWMMIKDVRSLRDELEEFKEETKQALHKIQEQNVYIETEMAALRLVVLKYLREQGHDMFSEL